MLRRAPTISPLWLRWRSIRPVQRPLREPPSSAPDCATRAPWPLMPSAVPIIAQVLRASRAAATALLSAVSAVSSAAAAGGDASHVPAVAGVGRVDVEAVEVLLNVARRAGGVSVGSMAAPRDLEGYRLRVSASSAGSDQDAHRSQTTKSFRTALRDHQTVCCGESLV